MPPIDVAMARSLHRRSVLDVLATAVYPVLSRRDTLSDVKTAFSSWDNCMAAVYCKWPVIAVIIIGGLIIVSLICPPRGKSHKYLDEPFVPPDHGYQNRGQNQNQIPNLPPQPQPQLPQQYGVQNTGYRPEEPMMTGAAPIARAPVKDTPQFATFEVTKKQPVDEDALPEMPSWERANHTKVYLEEESVELTDLKKPVPRSESVSPIADVRGSPGAVSPPPLDSANPYGGYGGPAAVPTMGGSQTAVSNGYMAAGAIPRSAGPGNQGYGQNNQGYNQNKQGFNQGNRGYGQSNPGFNQSNQKYGQNSQGYQNGQGYNQSSQGYNQNSQGYGQNNQNNQNNQGYNNSMGINRQYSASEYSDAPGYGGQAMGTRQQTPVQSPPGYGGRTLAPQQPAQQAFAARNMQGNGGYDNFRSNGVASPGPQGFNNMDRRTPRIPDVGMGPGVPGAPGTPGTPGNSTPAGTGAFGPSELYGGPSPRSPPNVRPLDSRPPIRAYSPATPTTPAAGVGDYNSGSNNHADAYEMPGSMPVANSASGFDFSSSYSRPQPQRQNTYDSGRGNGYSANNTGDESYAYTNSASPPPLIQPQPRQGAYPGYRPYQ